MRLPNIRQKIKDLPDLPKDIFILLLIFLVGTGAFLLGQYSVYEEKKGGELRIIEESHPNSLSMLVSPESLSARVTKEDTTPTSPLGMYVGSRSGTTYHLPWCTGAKRIKEENRIWFNSREDAVKKGYKPATNCKGI